MGMSGQWIKSNVPLLSGFSRNGPYICKVSAIQYEHGGRNRAGLIPWPSSTPISSAGDGKGCDNCRADIHAVADSFDIISTTFIVHATQERLRIVLGGSEAENIVLELAQQVSFASKVSTMVSRWSLRGDDEPGATEQKDGGLSGWIAVLSQWLWNFVWVGVTKGLGLMLPTVQEQLATQTWIIGWVASSVAAMMGLSASLAIPLSKRFEAGHIVIACGAVTGLSLIVSAFVVSPLQLAGLYAILAGSALGVMNVVIKENTGRCFTTNYATATGFARTGFSVGLFAYAPLVQLFLDTYGWRGTMLLTGAISLHMVPCGYLMVAARVPSSKGSGYEAVSQEDRDTKPAEPVHGCIKVWRYVFRNFDLALLGSANYWAVAVICCCSNVAFAMWVVYFVSQAESYGFTLLEASQMVTVAGVANLVAKILQGFITDRGLLSPFSAVCLLMLGTSFFYSASSWLTSYWGMMTTAVLILFNNGILSCQSDVLIKELLDVNLLAGAFGLIGTKLAILMMATGFLPGWLYDVTGSYKACFIVMGIVHGLSLIPLVVVKGFKTEQ